MTDSNYQKNSDVLRDYSEDKQYIDDYFRASRQSVCMCADEKACEEKTSV